MFPLSSKKWNILETHTSTLIYQQIHLAQTNNAVESD